MRATVAKRIKRECYGESATNANARRYYRDKDTGSINADPMRKQYQQAKRDYVRGLR